MALSKKWKEPEDCYRLWYGEKSHNNFRLGEIQPVSVDEDIWVVNILCQDGTNSPSKERICRVSYIYLKICLLRLVYFCRGIQITDGVSIHMPRIDCGLAGGDWSKVEEIINETLIKEGLDVTVYDLPK